MDSHVASPSKNSLLIPHWFLIDHPLLPMLPRFFIMWSLHCFPLNSTLPFKLPMKNSSVPRDCPIGEFPNEIPMKNPFPSIHRALTRHAKSEVIPARNPCYSSLISHLPVVPHLPQGISHFRSHLPQNSRKKSEFPPWIGKIPRKMPCFIQKWWFHGTGKKSTAVEPWWNEDSKIETSEWRIYQEKLGHSTMGYLPEIKLTCAKRREFSGMIHWLTNNNNPSNPHCYPFPTFSTSK